MKVKLVSYSQPATDFRRNNLHEGLEDIQDLIAFCARVSNPNNQFSTATSEKLIRYLVKHAHWSPLEMASACMEVETTRDIARQMLRHRSFSFQEFSQRYADPTKDLDFVLREARLQDTKNRQNSIETEDPALQAWWDAKQKFIIENVRQIYGEAIERGIAKEQARAILPEGNTVSRLYMNGTIRSWIHFIQIRSGNGTQKEHMEIAREVAKAITEIFPMANDFVSE